MKERTLESEPMLVVLDEWNQVSRFPARGNQLC